MIQDSRSSGADISEITTNAEKANGRSKLIGCKKSTKIQIIHSVCFLFLASLKKSKKF